MWPSATGALGALAHVEGAKPHQRDRITLLQGLGQCIDHTIKGFACSGFGNISRCGHGIDQFGFVHCCPLYENCEPVHTGIIKISRLYSKRQILVSSDFAGLFQAGVTEMTCQTALAVMLRCTMKAGYYRPFRQRSSRPVWPISGSQRVSPAVRRLWQESCQRHHLRPAGPGCAPAPGQTPLQSTLPGEFPAFS